MISKKIQCILALFIILTLSMNVFAATNFTDDLGDGALQSSSEDKVVADAAADSAADQSDDSNNNENSANTGSTNADPSTESGKTQMPSFGNGTFNLGNFGNETTIGNGTFNFGTFGNITGFGGNGTTYGTFGNGTSFGNGTFNFGNGGNNSSGFDFNNIMDMFKKLMGGNDTDTTNDTNESVVPVDTEVSDVPKVATSTSYAPASQAPVEKSSHSVIRLRDNTTVSNGDALRLEGVDKLFDSDFSNGHLLVYIDGKLVFNEITSDDLSTPIFWISDDCLGQHQVTVEFTPANGITNKYTEDVLIN